MFEDLYNTRDVQRRVRPWLAGVAVIAGATTAVACGDSSDDAADKAATTKPAAKAAAPTTAKPAAEGPNDLGQDVPADVKAWSDAGTMRLAAARIGTPGKLVVEPVGNVSESDPKSWDHWYPKGTKVTIKAENTRTARFAEWAGACTGKTPTCTVELTEFKRVIAGFNIDKKGAKGLSKDDPRLKYGTGS